MCIFSKLPCSVHVSGYCSYLFDTEKLFILDTIGKGFVSLNVTFSWLERATVKISPWNMNPIPVPSDIGLAIFYTTTDYLHSECRFFWKSNVKRLRISKVLQWGMPVSFGFNIRLSPILNLRCSQCWSIRYSLPTHEKTKHRERFALLLCNDMKIVRVRLDTKGSKHGVFSYH